MCRRRHRLSEEKSSEDQTELFFSFFESERKHFELDANFFDAAAAFDGFRLIDRKWKVDQQSLFSNQSLVNDDPESTDSSHFLGCYYDSLRLIHKQTRTSGTLPHRVLAPLHPRAPPR